MALELSGELLPPRALYVQLRADLRAIRQAYPVVTSIHHHPPWKPGEVFAKITSAQIAQINASEFGPVTSQISGSWYLLQFTHRYHPVVLGALLQLTFGVQAVEPVWYVGDGDNIAFTDSPPNRVYTFSHGWGDCPSGCISRHYWEFAVPPAGPVTLVREYGTPWP